MLGLPSDTRQLPAPWVLARSGLGIRRLRPRLLALRPRCRSVLTNRIRDQLAAVSHVTLYHEVFGEYPDGWHQGELNPIDMAVALVQRINEERFPVNLAELDEWFYAGEEGELPWWIPYQSYGVPWELMGILEINGPCRPLAAIYALSGGAPVCDWVDHREVDDMVSYWDTLPVTGCAVEYTWPTRDDGILMMRERLAALPEPLNGLATMLDCTVKRTGNVFIDRPETWASEYDWADDDYSWCADCIDLLARQWDQCREGVTAMLAYIEWMQHHYSPHRLGVVVETLCRVGRQVDRALARGGSPRPRTLAELFTEEAE